MVPNFFKNHVVSKNICEYKKINPPKLKGLKMTKNWQKNGKKLIITRFMTSYGPLNQSKRFFWKIFHIIPDLLKILVPKF